MASEAVPVDLDEEEKEEEEKKIEDDPAPLAAIDVARKNDAPRPVLSEFDPIESVLKQWQRDFPDSYLKCGLAQLDPGGFRILSTSDRFSDVIKSLPFTVPAFKFEALVKLSLASEPSDPQIRFLRCLHSVDLSGSVMRLPTGVFLFGDKNHGSDLFIRSCYSKLFDIVYSQINRLSDIDQHAGRVTVTGTAGIGKSTFAFYFIAKILQLTGVDHPPIAYYYGGLRRWYLFLNGHVFRANPQQVERYLDEPETIRVFDCTEGVQVEGRPCKTLALASPRTFLQMGPFGNKESDIRCMPTWTIQECVSLSLLLKGSFDSVEPEETVRRYLIAGGVPRYVCFKSKSEFIKRVETAITNVDPTHVFENASLYKQSWADITNAVLHSLSDPVTFEHRGNTLASHHVCARLAKTCMEKRLKETVDFIRDVRISGNKDALGFAGDLFEAIVLQKLRHEGGTYAIRCLNGPNKNKESKFVVTPCSEATPAKRRRVTLHMKGTSTNTDDNLIIEDDTEMKDASAPSSAVPNPEVLQFEYDHLQLENNEDFFFRDAKDLIRLLEPDRLLIPDTRIFQSIDALYGYNLLQITVSADHGAKWEGLKSVIAAITKRDPKAPKPHKLLFVVPDYAFRDYPAQSFKFESTFERKCDRKRKSHKECKSCTDALAGEIEQWVLSFPLSPLPFTVPSEQPSKGSAPSAPPSHRRKSSGMSEVKSEDEEDSSGSEDANEDKQPIPKADRARRSSVKPPSPAKSAANRSSRRPSSKAATASAAPAQSKPRPRAKSASSNAVAKSSVGKKRTRKREDAQE